LQTFFHDSAVLRQGFARQDKSVALRRQAFRMSALQHFNPAMANAAQTLYNHMKIFGNIRTKTYKEKSVVMQVLLVDLQDGRASQVVTARRQQKPTMHKLMYTHKSNNYLQ
jgi:hypothetical protein